MNKDKIQPLFGYGRTNLVSSSLDNSTLKKKLLEKHEMNNEKLQQQILFMKDKLFNAQKSQFNKYAMNKNTNINYRSRNTINK